MKWIMSLPPPLLAPLPHAQREPCLFRVACWLHSRSSLLTTMSPLFLRFLVIPRCTRCVSQAGDNPVLPSCRRLRLVVNGATLLVRPPTRTRHWWPHLCRTNSITLARSLDYIATKTISPTGTTKSSVENETSPSNSPILKLIYALCWEVLTRGAVGRGQGETYDTVPWMNHVLSLWRPPALPNSRCNRGYLLLVMPLQLHLCCLSSPKYRVIHLIIIILPSPLLASAKVIHLATPQQEQRQLCQQTDSKLAVRCSSFSPNPPNL